MAERKLCAVDGCCKPLFARGLCRRHYSQSSARHLCSVEGCDRPINAHSLCLMHYKRSRRNGSPHAVQRPANGEAEAWLVAHAGHVGDECLIWPFWRDKYGYGSSRDMCQMAHGKPPTKNHQAAHSCGNGHKGCVHPGHLRWATRGENQTEMVEHGNSQRGEKNWNAKLTVEQVRAIRQEAPFAKSYASVAGRFAVVRQTVSDIMRGKSWAWLK